MCADRMRPFHIFCRDIYNTPSVKWQHWERNGDGKMEPLLKEGSLRKAAYAAEIKSAHFGKHQITVHPVVCFYRSGYSVVRESLIFLSDGTGHDHHTVREFTHRSVELLRTKIPIRKHTIWSDGAASQYKRCYYGSEHGKGEADGETGVLSQALKRANYQSYDFKNAKEMVEYLSQNYGTNTRKYILVDKIDRTDLTEDVQTIPGTRKYHQFQALGEYVLQARRLACFCTACREKMPVQCMNLDIVGAYTVRKCKPSAHTVLKQGFVEAPETHALSVSQSLANENPCPNIGDFVKLTCHVHKATKNYYATVSFLKICEADMPCSQGNKKLLCHHARRHFTELITDEMIENIELITNIYALAKGGIELKVTSKEISTFIALYLRMGLMKGYCLRAY
ncbi:hypothetical protein RRG08_001686 [Elysia crispata]|uniref:Uncharacterized protein n=1 Tax=Elysia crispata TaxID=231223 RepID=A0AAE1ALE9_9GAST|nr:hypothetical protein RRG08_001686 [Elysia crispata]